MYNRPRGRTMRRRKTRAMNQRTFVRNLTRKLYPVCKHDSDCDKQTNQQTYAQHRITYGEMEYEGIDILHAFVQNIRPNIDTFIDIGSGRGKLCMYMASKPEINRCLGVELVESRHNDAIHLKQKLASDYANKVEFVNSDIFNIDFASYGFQRERVFIWFSNLCFDPEITDKIFEKLKRELPVGTVIACSNPLNQDVVDGYRLLDTTKIPMSWNKESRVNVYTIL